MVRFLLGVISGILFVALFLWETPSNIDFPLWVMDAMFIMGFAIWQGEEKKWW